MGGMTWLGFVPVIDMVPLVDVPIWLTIKGGRMISCYRTASTRALLMHLESLVY